MKRLVAISMAALCAFALLSGCSSAPEVKRVDHLVLAIEKPILMGQSVIHWDLPEIDHTDPTVIVAKALISCATIESSKRLFLDFFKELKETKNV
jgi:uncharacterized protein YcfL